MTEQHHATRYGITPRTVKNWQETGAKSGVLPPWDDPAGLLEWYRSQLGREPNNRLKTRVEELTAPAPPAAAATPEPSPAALQPGHTLAALQSACEALGLSSTLARIVDEEDRAWAEYQAAREKNYNIEAARRNWKEATEAKRAVHKTDDAVQVALKLLKGWARGEWEARWKRLRIRLSGLHLGRELREELQATTTDDAWATVWDKGFEKTVLDWQETGLVPKEHTND